jgi:hypothetical protein
MQIAQVRQITVLDAIEAAKECGCHFPKEAVYL